jgi:hypothetical protein
VALRRGRGKELRRKKKEKREREKGKKENNLYPNTDHSMTLQTITQVGGLRVEIFYFISFSFSPPFLKTVV